MTKPERIVYANPAFEQLSGQSLVDVANQPWDSLRGHAEQAGVELPLGTAIAQANDYAGTFRIEPKDGATSTVEAYSNVIVDDNDRPAYRLAVLVDVSGNDASDRQKFQQLIREKDVQLQEIQHRVKNNLQMITALVRIEARKARGRRSPSPASRRRPKSRPIRTADPAAGLAAAYARAASPE